MKYKKLKFVLRIGENIKFQHNGEKLSVLTVDDIFSNGYEMTVSLSPVSADAMKLQMTKKEVGK